MSREIVNPAEITRHQRFEPQLIVADRDQPEKITGQSLGQLGKRPFNDVGDGHIDVDVPGQLVQNFKAPILFQYLLVALFQLDVVVEL